MITTTNFKNKIKFSSEGRSKRQDLETKINQLATRLDGYRLARQENHQTAVDLQRRIVELQSQLTKIETKEKRAIIAKPAIQTLNVLGRILGFSTGIIDQRSRDIFGKKRK